jgi:hypothetical protein
MLQEGLSQWKSQWPHRDSYHMLLACSPVPQPTVPPRTRYCDTGYVCVCVCMWTGCSWINHHFYNSSSSSSSSNVRVRLNFPCLSSPVAVFFRHTGLLYPIDLHSSALFGISFFFSYIGCFHPSLFPVLRFTRSTVFKTTSVLRAYFFGDML